MRKSELYAQFGLLFGLPVFALLAGMFLCFLGSSPQNPVMVFSLLLLGFGFFLKAKLSVIRSGRLVTFGTRCMTQPNRTCYIIGYILMVSALPFW